MRHTPMPSTNTQDHTHTHTHTHTADGEPVVNGATVCAKDFAQTKTQPYIYTLFPLRGQ